MSEIPASIIIVCFLTAFINWVNVVIISTRIVGVQTRKVASSNSVFNIIALAANVAGATQAPLLAKTIEKSIIEGHQPYNFLFRLIIFSATIGSIAGAFSIPSLHRILKKGVESLYRQQSVLKVITASLRPSSFAKIKQHLAFPNGENFRRLSSYQDMPVKLLVINILVYGFITISILSCLYAGYLNPLLRTTALSLNGVALGLGTLGMMLFIEPFNSILVDKVIDGAVTEGYMRKYFAFVAIARVLGTILGQFLFIPMAHVIIFIAEIIKI